MDRKSENFSSIKFAFNTVFNADELQWLLMVHSFPQKVKLTLNNDDFEEVKDTIQQGVSLYGVKMKT